VATSVFFPFAKDIHYPALAMKLAREVEAYIYPIFTGYGWTINRSLPITERRCRLFLPVFVNYNAGPERIARLLFSEMVSYIPSMGYPHEKEGNFSTVKLISRHNSDVRLHDLYMNWVFADASSPSE
jgi:hypothetical protein